MTSAHAGDGEEWTTCSQHGDRYSSPTFLGLANRQVSDHEPAKLMDATHIKVARSTRDKRN